MVFFSADFGVTFYKAIAQPAAPPKNIQNLCQTSLTSCPETLQW